MRKYNFTVCQPNQCAGCMACMDICPRQAISVADDKKYMNAVIDKSRCIHCNACHNVCQRNHPAEMREPMEWLQGWGNDLTRTTSSSGGFGQEAMRTALKHGFIVTACHFEKGDFRFGIIEDESELADYVGSKYVKSNPIGIYREVRRKLIQGKRVLFIGLPCQVSSMRNFTGDHKNLYTIDLICHGSPSVQLLKESMKDYGYDLSKVDDIHFREHDRFGITSRPVSIVPKGVQDCYTRAFLQGLCYTENCYSCQYARTARVGDITMGDSWGTEMPEELHKGLSLVLCQTEKGREFLHMMDFKFWPVDRENSIKLNKQLQRPSLVPSQREKFFQNLEKGISFNHAVGIAYPKEYIKQSVKKFLIISRLYRGGGRF